MGRDPVKVIDPGQMLGEVDDDLKRALGIDVEGVVRRMTRYGFPVENWKPYRLYDGLEVLMPGAFNVTLDENGDTLLYPEGDLTAPPSARMPNGGYFFDSIERQGPIDDERLDPRDNLEEYQPISEVELNHLECAAKRARATGRAVIASFGGTRAGRHRVRARRPASSIPRASARDGVVHLAAHAARLRARGLRGAVRGRRSRTWRASPSAWATRWTS